jgi:hypothetical protein
MAAARWQAAVPRGDVARVREGQGGGARAVTGVQVTRGVCPRWRWRRGGAGTTVSSADNQEQRKQRSGAGRQRKKKRKRVRGTRLRKQKNPRTS